MSSTVKSLEVTHNPINNGDTFTHGNVVTGVVTLEVAKECHIDSLSIKFKGKAEVLWTERHGQTTVVYHSKDKYFSTKHYFTRDGADSDETHLLLTNASGQTYNNVVAPGCHVYPFTFTFPEGDFPSAFDAETGKIIYLLEARLGRSMRVPKKDREKLNFVARVDHSSERGLLEPQHDCKDKKLKFFSSGTVSMDVCLDKTGYLQGEGIKVKAHIQNNSSRSIKPKYCLYRKNSFFARGKRRLHCHDILKEVGDPIPPSSEETVFRVITVPIDVEPSIHNCSNIKSEHRLRVYLDVKYATDPEIKFPVVVLPISGISAWALPPAESDFGEQTQSYPTPAGGMAPSGPPAWGAAPSGPPASGASSSGPPAWGAAPSGPPSWGAAPSGPPARGAAPSGPPVLGAASPGPPAWGAAPSGPPASGAASSGPPAWGTAPLGPPAWGVAPSGPPASGAAPSGPPASGAASSGPPAWGAAPSGPPAWGAAPSGEATNTQASEPPPPYGAYAMYPPPSQ